MLEIQNVSQTFNAGTVNQKTALNGLNLKRNEGDFVTVIEMCIRDRNKLRAARLIGNTVTLFMAGSVVLAAVLVGLVDPVSYTHLDVYKRQVSLHMNRSARGVGVVGGVVGGGV